MFKVFFETWADEYDDQALTEKPSKLPAKLIGNRSAGRGTIQNKIVCGHLRMSAVKSERDSIADEKMFCVGFGKDIEGLVNCMANELRKCL